MITAFVDDLSSFVLSLGEQSAEFFSSALHWTILANGDADFHDNVILVVQLSN